MKHNIRINGEVKEIDCQLGSGVLDKNGREIFEGDDVMHHKCFISEVKFEGGALCIDGSPISFYDAESLMVIEHAATGRRQEEETKCEK